MFFLRSMLSPDEVQWLVLVPDPPPGPTFIQQVPMVLCSMCPDRVFTVVAALVKVRHRYITYSVFVCTNCNFTKMKPMIICCAEQAVTTSKHVVEVS